MIRMIGRSIWAKMAVVAVLGVALVSCSQGDKVGGSGSIETIGEGADQITLVKVSGNRYEMGYWYGKLLADQIAATWQIVQGMIKAEGVPEQLFAGATDTLWGSGAFDIAEWEAEVNGIADGCAAAGHPEITFRVLQQISAIPDLSEYNCSLVAAWGKATVNGDTYQVRNLDWTMDSGLQDYPVVIVYSPDEGNKHIVAGFAGVIGVSVGGISEEGLAVSEIMGHFCDDETLNGIPFPFLLRDILYYDGSLDEALDRMRNATRTNQYHYCVADPDAEDPKARLLFTSNSRFDEYKDNESVKDHPCEEEDPFHEPLDDAVYWKRHDGGGNEGVYNSIEARYGKIDAEGTIEIAKAAGVDGTLVSIAYANTAREMYVAFAEGATPAHRQKYVRVGLND